MTRSDNPFEDLPEWKERRRLQEAQAQQRNAEPGGYPEPLQPGYGQPHQQYPGDQQGYAPADYGNAGGFQEPLPVGHPQYQGDTQGYPVNEQPADRGVDEFGQPIGAGLRPEPQAPQYYDDPGQYDRSAAYRNAQAPLGGPVYDTAGQAVYPNHVGEQAPATYVDPNEPPQGYQSGMGYPAEPDMPGFAQQDARYNNPNAYQPDAQLGPAGDGQNTGFDLNHFSPGQQADDFGGANGMTYVGAPGAADQRQSLQANPPEYGQPGEDGEYYEEDEEGGGFSWKLAAAVIVTGAVVTGGGVVLYDSFKGGGLGRNGAAPVIKAQRGPAKTIPKDAGGRQFSNRDSKLLGRLDKSGGAATADRQNEANGADGRVRTVPTVRIGRDGRLILPKAPEVASAPPANNASGGAPATPGINIVNNLSDRSGTGLGGLPAVVPKTEPAAASATPPAAQPSGQDTRVPAIRSSVQAPVVKNRPIGNRAISQSNSPPPVPSKSAYTTALRTNGSAQNSAIVAPTTPRAAAPARSASTLGAGAVARSAARGYVAVLATAPTRMTALKSFAELQQKHPVALQNRVPDLQKVDLKSRGLGIMYRVVVGPASSRGAASSVCNKLKTEGYKGCWVKSN
jgi:SPOR domain